MSGSQAYDLAKIERGGSRLPVYDESLGRPTGGAGPVERSFLIRPELPCGTCDHAAVCSIRPKLEAASIEYRTPASPDPAVHVRASLSIECDHYRAGQALPVPEPAPAAFHRKVSEAERIRTSAARGAANSKAKRAAGTAGSSVGTLSTIRGPQKDRPSNEAMYAAIRANVAISYGELAKEVGWEATAIAYRLKSLRARGELPEDIGTWLDTRREKAGAGIRRP